MSDKTEVVKTEQKLQESFRKGITLSPPVDIMENEDEVMLITDLPGVKAEDLSVDYNNNVLRIDAYRENTIFGAVNKDFDTAVNYQRSFSVPNEIDASKIEAKLVHGVLNLSLPKHERVKTRQIVVKAG